MAGKSKAQAIASLDWTGVFLFATGLLLVLVALSVGGTIYAWDSAGFIAMFIVGVASLVGLGFWESFAAKNPFMPGRLFKGKTRTYTMVLIITFVSGMGLYAAAAFWTQLCRGMWGAGLIRTGVYSIPGGVGGVGKCKARKSLQRSQLILAKWAVSLPACS